MDIDQFVVDLDRISIDKSLCRGKRRVNPIQPYLHSAGGSGDDGRSNWPKRLPRQPIAV
jgi:hypothetical protein